MVEKIGMIEQIGTGKEEDTLMISNGKPNGWIFSLFIGYRQLGCYKIKKPHSFKEGDFVLCKFWEDGEISSVEHTKLERHP